MDRLDIKASGLMTDEEIEGHLEYLAVFSKPHRTTMILAESGSISAANHRHRRPSRPGFASNRRCPWRFEAKRRGGAAGDGGYVPKKLIRIRS